jgi:predicted AlkP superfamily pyrophosphatase or phosphodiesterase
MARTLFILLDGLRYDTARECLGYMEALVRCGDAQVYKVSSELPSISRPLYETLMTGRPPAEHGIVSNEIVRRSEQPNVFDIARANGLSTAAAAYYWFSELYNGVPFERSGRFIESGDGGIQHGVFYWRDHYPDDHLFADADGLVRRQRPDFLLLHPMNADDVGHKEGGASSAYRKRRQGAE